MKMNRRKHETTAMATPRCPTSYTVNIRTGWHDCLSVLQQSRHGHCSRCWLVGVAGLISGLHIPLRTWHPIITPLVDQLSVTTKRMHLYCQHTWGALFRGGLQGIKIDHYYLSLPPPPKNWHPSVEMGGGALWQYTSIVQTFPGCCTLARDAKEINQ